MGDPVENDHITFMEPGDLSTKYIVPSRVTTSAVVATLLKTKTFYQEESHS